ncbi:MAG: HAMP domain-containing histidine kinase [Humibacillus sp.]|nr:HAMP domain-containing histidine kinase [Humibacillus sp.]MDN5775296.1 HAMP domain-containing histidine kinase [Humibacillus sp.]
MSVLKDVMRRRRVAPPTTRIISVGRAPVGPKADLHDFDDVRSLCHDLRQPLAAISLLARADEADTQTRLAGIRHEVDWLSDLVDSVLGDPGIAESEVIDLGELARFATSCVAAPSGTNLSLDVADAVLVRGRRVPLARALMCLLDNALRAAGGGGRVEVTVRRRAGYAVIAVTDDGPGVGRILPQHSLGLVTVRAVLADCAGHLDLDNGVWGGAVATVTIPLATESGPV